MQRIFLLGLIFTILFSCEKKDNFCEDDICNTYFKIWKDLIISRNHLTESYFNEHIFPYATMIDSWNDGKSFRVEYRVRIDWAQAKLNDQFIIWLDPSTSGIFPSIPTPRSTYLTKEQINKLIDQLAFSSSIHHITMTDQLKYSSLQEALQVLTSASGVADLKTGEVFYEEPSFQVSTGHPFLRSGATISQSENKCMSCQIDLVSGVTEVRQQPCIIYFCFEKGTQITISNGKSQPVEKIKINDTILSVDTNTLLIEDAIVQKIDSVIHNDMIKIIFSDMTTNKNTSDHPYYVKTKGWSSYNPEKTLNKYGIRTSQLQTGDICFKYKNSKLTEVSIQTITKIPGKSMTFNISKLSKNKTYFANGILVSNEE
jgi:hypothetical protein